MEKERQDLETRLIQKAWDDDAFRQELLTNPKSVVEREIGQLIPDDLEIRVVEESPKVFYLRLPVNPDSLPDAIMDLVAGGGSTYKTQSTGECKTECGMECYRNYSR